MEQDRGFEKRLYESKHSTPNPENPQGDTKESPISQMENLLAKTQESEKLTENEKLQYYKKALEYLETSTVEDDPEELKDLLSQIKNELELN